MRAPIATTLRSYCARRSFADKSRCCRPRRLRTSSRRCAGSHRTLTSSRTIPRRRSTCRASSCRPAMPCRAALSRSRRSKATRSSRACSRRDPRVSRNPISRRGASSRSAHAANPLASASGPDTPCWARCLRSICTASNRRSCCRCRGGRFSPASASTFRPTSTRP